MIDNDYRVEVFRLRLEDAARQRGEVRQYRCVDQPERRDENVTVVLIVLLVGASKDW